MGSTSSPSPDAVETAKGTAEVVTEGASLNGFLEAVETIWADE